VTSVLLDTCAVIWLANGDRLRQQAIDAIVAAGQSVATARHLGVPVVTRDARILTYARRGHMAAIRC
jgi:PIN domain nuclease of toxin-antitoxin system